MANRRLLRVADLLREELSDIIRRTVHDPRVSEHDFTVTRVEVSADLSLASVHISTLATAAERDALIDGLRRAAGFIHRELLKRIHLKTVPTLEFSYDPGLVKAQRIADILAGLKKGQ
jgi:ribosome-binding factor A